MISLHPSTQPLNHPAFVGVVDPEEGAGGPAPLLLQKLLGRDVRGLQLHLRGRLVQGGERERDVWRGWRRPGGRCRSTQDCDSLLHHHGSGSPSVWSGAVDSPSFSNYSWSIIFRHGPPMPCVFVYPVRNTAGPCRRLTANPTLHTFPASGSCRHEVPRSPRRDPCGALCLGPFFHPLSARPLSSTPPACPRTRSIKEPCSRRPRCVGRCVPNPRRRHAFCSSDRPFFVHCVW